MVLFVGLSFNTDVAVAPTARAQTPVPPEVIPIPPVATTTPTEAPKAKKVDAMASNCYLYVRSIYPNLPLTKDIVSNTTPYVGAVAFFKYGKLNHYGVITKIEEDGFWIEDSNFGGPGYRTHKILLSNPHIRGFFNPNM